MSDWKFNKNEKLDKFEKERHMESGLMTHIAYECWHNARDHGFDLAVKNDQIVAFVDEVGEWCAAVRNGDTENELEEVVDIMVRIMAYAREHFPTYWHQALISKMKYNRGRPYKHGKKF